MKNNGRYFRARRAFSTSSRWTIACGAPVEEITTSTRSSTRCQSSKRTALPPISRARSWARSNDRFATKIDFAPRETRLCAVIRLISPAPRIITSLFLRWPKIFSARSTATLPTEVEPSWIEVSVRTFLPTPNARWKSLFNTAPVAPASKAAP